MARGVIMLVVPPSVAVPLVINRGYIVSFSLRSAEGLRQQLHCDRLQRPHYAPDAPVLRRPCPDMSILDRYVGAIRLDDRQEIGGRGPRAGDPAFRDDLQRQVKSLRLAAGALAEAAYLGDTLEPSDSEDEMEAESDLDNGDEEITSDGEGA